MFKKILSGMLGSASQVSVEELQKEYGQLLVQSEVIELGFVLIRDMFNVYQQKTYIC